MERRKTRITALCIALIMVASVAGVVAYLTHTTEVVQNTFVAGKIIDNPDNFVVKEHQATDTDKDGVYTLGTEEVTENTYSVLPGVDLPKDPYVKTTETLKLDAYVFIEVLDTTGTSMTCTVDSDNWTELTGVTPKHTDAKVYVMKANNGIAEADSALGPISILENDKIIVKNDAITDADAQFGGEVKFYGYMIQAGGFADAKAAWGGL